MVRKESPHLRHVFSPGSPNLDIILLFLLEVSHNWKQVG